jgi:hypothetical protein
MNKVCDKHKPLASTVHREDHPQLSQHVLELIDQAKTRNLKQVEDMMSKETRPRVYRELLKARASVIQHNEDITEEWNELVIPPHAFDKHIHDDIVKTMVEKAKVQPPTQEKSNRNG